jgi:hypothetical protein
MNLRRRVQMCIGTDLHPISALVRETAQCTQMDGSDVFVNTKEVTMHVNLTMGQALRYVHDIRQVVQWEVRRVITYGLQ